MGLIDAFPENVNLDDRKFDDIVNEARTLLARYGKEWTDYNFSDPGITFIELFAWIAEMQIYQLNRVTDANYRKFLKLVGMTPAFAQPARADITFEDVGNNNVPINAGMQVITEKGNGKIIFETEENLTIVPGKIKSILTTFDTQTIDNTGSNEKGDVYFAAFGDAAPVDATLKLGFDNSFPGKEIRITFILYEEDLEPAGNHGNEPSAVFPSATLIWEYSAMGKLKPLSVRKDTTNALTRSGRVIFDWPSDIDKDEEKSAYWIQCRILEGSYEIMPLVSKILLNTISAVQIERIIREDLGKGKGIPDQVVQLKNDPYINRIDFAVEDITDWPGLLNQLKEKGNLVDPGPEKKILSFFEQGTQDCINRWKGDKEPDEVLKYAVIDTLNKILNIRELYDLKSFKSVDLSQLSENFFQKIEFCPDLEVRTLNRFLMEAVFPNKIEKNRLVIQLEKMDGESEYWYEIEDFELSGPEDTHYIFNQEKNQIIFGNGLNGRIPLDSQQILASYKVTLGPGGNIPGGQNFLINESGISGIKGKNMRAATAGKAAETMDDAKNRAKNECREIYRSITSGDYEYLAIHTPGLRVARAKAIPNYNPDIPLIKIPDTVTLVAVPYMREGNITPAAGEGFLQTISRHLDQHRLITTNIIVISPKYEKITISCNIYIKKGKSPKDIIELTKKKLDQFLSPMKGGPDGTGWPFGRAAYPSEIYQIIDEVEGVDYATNLSFIDDKGQHYKGIIKISPISLVYPGEHQFKIIEAKL
ncbi:MAG: putative baseplate assembly protein [Candidatus Methanoperedens sp.]|nr:putative baseplate assembly protein [Candidatus Methanoperedens sp.]